MTTTPKKSQHEPTPTAEEVLRRMLNTPPKQHADMAVRKPKPKKRSK